MGTPAKNLMEIIATAYNLAVKVEGLITERELKFLALMAASGTAEGKILEIGSFKGKSTVVLAKASALAGLQGVEAVDPMNAPAPTDPDLKGKDSSLDDFKNNIAGAGINDYINFHQMFSSELGNKWDKAIRLLWIDGDHTYAGCKNDFDMFAKHLTDKAIIALHDVLILSCEGPLRVFMENILPSDNFGPAGLCGNIGWAQYSKDPHVGQNFRKHKRDLYNKLVPLLPHIVLRDPHDKISTYSKLKWRIFRALVPHGEINPQRWLKQIRH